jgi:23S rRNA-/tRNA-specific pseudouridylate synthase
MYQVVFQNENFIVCDKGANVLSVPAREVKDPRPCLGLELQRELKTQIFPVHRLDYEVSGLIMYALSSKSHGESQTWFQQRKIQKNYTARTGLQNFSRWPENIKTDRSAIEVGAEKVLVWRTQMQRGKRRSFESTHGEWAETHARARFFESGLEWDLYPVTGKPHQLRFELARRGFPIWGDALYGSAQKWPLPGIALRAIELDLAKISNRLGLPENMKLKKWDL